MHQFLCLKPLPYQSRRDYSWRVTYVGASQLEKAKPL